MSVGIKSSSCCFAAALGVWVSCIVTPARADEPLAKGIQDNSCIVEEAYNQEPGVVQHIACAQRQHRAWSLAFTQEWPIVSQTHQFSYTIPYSWLHPDEQRVRGVGDVLLNYRLQALSETDVMPAFAPRLSLILPTGSSSKGLGEGSLGYQVLFPLSKIVSDRVTLHANAGATWYSDVRGQQPTTLLVGGSVIYAVTRNFNLMLEATHEWAEDVSDLGAIEREKRFTISPGIRYAFNFAPPGQLVVGVGAPIRFTNGVTDFGALLYISVEHGFTR